MPILASTTTDLMCTNFLEDCETGLEWRKNDGVERHPSIFSEKQFESDKSALACKK